MKILKADWIGYGVRYTKTSTMALDARVFDYDKDGNPMYYSETEEQYYIVKN